MYQELSLGYVKFEGSVDTHVRILVGSRMQKWKFREEMLEM